MAAVARAIALLDELAAAPDGLGTNEAARRIAVNPSSASRLLATLQAGGLADRTGPDGRWRLGPHLVSLADRALAALDVREIARPHLRALAAATGESVTLSVPGGGEAVTVEFVPGAGSVVSVARLGRSSVAHATATGKVMLAFGGGALPAAPLEAFTRRTITDPTALAAEIERVVTRGFADAVGERETDLVALAVPVRGPGDRLVAICGLQGPAARLPARRRREMLGFLRETAAEIARALGAEPR